MNATPLPPPGDNVTDLDGKREERNKAATEPAQLRHRFGVKYFAKNEGQTVFLVKTLAEDVCAQGPLAEGHDDRIWAYSQGVWRPAPKIVRDRASALLGERYAPGRADSVNDVIRSMAPKITCDPVEPLINFRNCMLDWRTGQTCPHDPAFSSTIQLPVDWNPDATCPAFDAFMSEVVAPDDIPLVWEVIGYLMYSGNPLHKAIMLFGTGRNGKGTFLRVMEALLGMDNLTNVTLQDLSERFTTANLFGKLANIAGDIDGTYIEETAKFKAITGGDTVAGEHKFCNRFSFRPFAVPLFSANKIPGSADVTVGYFSRWVVVQFPVDFTGREARDLDAALSTPAELSGIAAKAMPYLRQLRAGGNFIETASSRAAMSEFRRRVNQVESWLDECCDRDVEHGHVSRTALYEAYARWADQEGFGKLKAREFYDRLGAARVEAAKVSGVRGFKGIKVTDACWGAANPPGAKLPYVPGTAPEPQEAPGKPTLAAFVAQQPEPPPAQVATNGSGRVDLLQGLSPAQVQLYHRHFGKPIGRG